MPPSSADCSRRPHYTSTIDARVDSSITNQLKTNRPFLACRSTSQRKPHQLLPTALVTPLVRACARRPTRRRQLNRAPQRPSRALPFAMSQSHRETTLVGREWRDVCNDRSGVFLGREVGQTGWSFANAVQPGRGVMSPLSTRAAECWHPAQPKVAARNRRAAASKPSPSREVRRLFCRASALDVGADRPHHSDLRHIVEIHRNRRQPSHDR